MPLDTPLKKDIVLTADLEAESGFNGADSLLVCCISISFFNIVEGVEYLRQGTGAMRIDEVELFE